jgi:hypothetical protein
MRAIQDLERISIELAYAVSDCRTAGSRILKKLDDVDAIVPKILAATLAIRIEIDELLLAPDRATIER